MDDVDEQLRSWGDAVLRESEPAVTAAEVMAQRTSGAAASVLDRTGAVKSLRVQARWVIGAAAAVLVVVVVASLVMIDRNRNEGEVMPLRAGDPDSTSSPEPSGSPQTEAPSDPVEGPVEFEVLAMGPALMDAIGSVRSVGIPSDLASLREDLEELWADAGQPPPAPEVDFGSHLILSITIPDDACPPELTRFDLRREDVEAPGDVVIEPVFVEPPGGCVEPLIPKTFIVAIDWQSTGDDFWLHLPGQSTYGYEDAWLHYVREKAAGNRNVTTGPDPSGSRAVIRAAIQARLIAEIPDAVASDGIGPLGAPGATSFAIDVAGSVTSFLSWAPVTANRPEDPRRGLAEPTTVGTDAGGVVWIGKLPDTGGVVRFDCAGVRYQLTATRSPFHLLDQVDALAAELGCSPPRAVAPTECLSLAGDPEACVEDHSGD